MSMKSFRMKLGKKLEQGKNHLKTPGKSFLNEDLINKILRCLNYNWQPKASEIYESKDLFSIDLVTLFEKLQEHEINLKRLAKNEECDKNEEGDKKKKNHALKATNVKGME